MPRYKFTPIINNNIEFYEFLRKNRQVKTNIVHYGTPVMHNPSAAERATIKTAQHMWTFGGGAVGANSDAAAFPYYVKAQEDADRLSPQQRALANQVWMRQTRIDVDRDALKTSEAALQQSEAIALAAANSWNLELSSPDDYTAAVDALTTQTEAHDSLVAELLGE